MSFPHLLLLFCWKRDTQRCFSADPALSKRALCHRVSVTSSGNERLQQETKHFASNRHFKHCRAAIRSGRFALFMALVTEKLCKQAVNSPFLQVDQKGPTPFIAKRREMGCVKGCAPAALSKVGAELRAQTKAPEVHWDALPRRPCFLLPSAFPS